MPTETAVLEALRQVQDPDLRRVRNKEGRPYIVWKPNKKERGNPPLYYVVYRFKGPATGDFESAANILYITPWQANEKKWTFLDKSAETGQIYTYAVKAVNRRHTEGPASRTRSIEKTETRVKNANPGFLGRLR